MPPVYIFSIQIGMDIFFRKNLGRLGVKCPSYSFYVNLSAYLVIVLADSAFTFGMLMETWQER